MAITNADGWFAAAKQKRAITKTASTATIAAQPSTTLDLAGNPGAGTLTIGNTANGLVPTSATAGYPTITAFAGGATGYLAAARYASSVAGRATLYDRLFNSGSHPLTPLGVTNLTAQPSFTARLPGGTDFTNIDILIEINVVVPATAVTVAIGYTKEDGATGRTTGASASLSGFATRRVIVMPLQAGDKGVQKIDSITIGGTAAATGSVNVVLARRLAQFDVRVANGSDPQAWDMIGAPEVFAASALWLVVQPDSTASGVPSLDVDIISG